MFCHECGTANPDVAKFCIECGERLVQPTSAVDLAGRTRAPSPSSSPGPSSIAESQTPLVPMPSSDIDLRQAGRTLVSQALGQGTLLAGRFAVERRLGAGAMGEVWLARDSRLERNVALKFVPALLARNSRAIDGLKREAQLLLDLTHPNICRMYDLEHDGDLVFLSMEWVEGQTLEELLDGREDRRMPIEEVLPIFQSVAHALDVAHQKSPPILHRDLKPANIMVTVAGQAKVMDFGIACQVRETMTRVTGQDVTGTLLYMSPEQFQGRALTAASDVYSLAATLYECLCGHPPFHGGAIGHQLLHEPAPSPRGLGALIAPHMDEAILRALAKSPAERFPSCLEFLESLQGAPEPVSVANSGGGAVKSPDLLNAPFTKSQAEAKRREWIRHLNLPETLMPNGSAFVLIPPGQFLMGNSLTPAMFAQRFQAFGEHPSERYADERPAHSVRITKPFWIAQHPVTVAQFRAFVEATRHVTDAESDALGGHGFNAATNSFETGKQYSWRSLGFEQHDDHPVVNVSWNDADAYRRWLSLKTGKKCRLASEAEWEYAARAGTTTLYYHGDDPEGLARAANVADATAKRQFKDWVTIKAEDGYAFTSPVGKFAANAFGVFDMLGNVWEWCGDWYGRNYYATSPGENPPGASHGTSRLLRGGSWHNGPVSGCCSHRHCSEPASRTDGIGFRLVIEL